MPLSLQAGFICQTGMRTLPAFSHCISQSNSSEGEGLTDLNQPFADQSSPHLSSLRKRKVWSYHPGSLPFSPYQFQFISAFSYGCHLHIQVLFCSGEWLGGILCGVEYAQVLINDVQNLLLTSLPLLTAPKVLVSILCRLHGGSRLPPIFILNLRGHKLDPQKVPQLEITHHLASFMPSSHSLTSVLGLGGTEVTAIDFLRIHRQV